LVGDFNPSHKLLTLDKYVQLGFNISSGYPVIICNSYVPKAMENHENMLRLQWKIMENLHFDLEYMGVVVNPTKHHNMSHNFPPFGSIWWDLDHGSHGRTKWMIFHSKLLVKTQMVPQKV
jgi:hypothetical protein